MSAGKRRIEISNTLDTYTSMTLMEYSEFIKWLRLVADEIELYAIESPLEYDEPQELYLWIEEIGTR